MATVSLVIVGNEILSGKFRDLNGPFAIETLRAVGADLKRIVTIEDDVDAIRDEVRESARAFDVVITSGGVGPTHDDVTFAGIAAAMDRPLEPHPGLLAMLRRYEIDETPSNLRMIRVARGAELVQEEPNTYPVIRVDNVYALPGIPKLFRRKLEAIAPLFAGPPLHSIRLESLLRETDLSDRLATIAATHPDVAIGSYPRTEGGTPHVVLTLESRSRAALTEAVSALAASIPVLSTGD